MKRIIFVISLLISLTAIAQVKWNPGHYITVPNYADKDMVIQEIASVAAIRGVQLRYTWKELEPQKDVYDFSKIDADISKFSLVNKKLVIFLMTKSFIDSSALPAYMDNYSYRYGATTKPGWNIKLWENEAKVRLEALVKALGAKYDSNPNVEAITFNETSLGDGLITTSQLEAYFTNMIYVLEKTKLYFPTTSIVQFVNYPRSILPKLTDAMLKAKVSIGGPDIFPKDKGLLIGAYTYYSKFSGVTPIMPSVQGQNYVTQCHNCPPDPLTLQQLYDYGKTNLFATHMFWTRTTTKDFAKVLEFFKSSTFPKDTAGGLNSKHPGCL